MEKANELPHPHQFPHPSAHHNHHSYGKHSYDISSVSCTGFQKQIQKSWSAVPPITQKPNFVGLAYIILQETENSF